MIPQTVATFADGQSEARYQFLSTYLMWATFTVPFYWWTLRTLQASRRFNDYGMCAGSKAATFVVLGDGKRHRFSRVTVDLLRVGGRKCRGGKARCACGIWQDKKAEELARVCVCLAVRC